MYIWYNKKEGVTMIGAIVIILSMLTLWAIREEKAKEV